jgi:hypothetical protein
MSLYDFVDKSLYRLDETKSIDGAISTPTSTTSVASTTSSSAISTTPAETFESGEMQGNISILDGYLESKGFVQGTTGWRLSADGTLYATNASLSGYISATSGIIGGFTITPTSLYGGIIKTGLSVGLGSTGVIMDTAGLRGYDSVLGLTFELPTDGGAPTFSSGIINSTVFEINTNAVMRTSATVGDGTAASDGILINNTGFYACEENQTLANANVRILTDGSGYFSGTFEIGGAVKTIEAVADLQTALDDVSTAGGGTVYLKSGTYTLTADIEIPSGVALEGVSRDSVIIDCDGSYAVKIAGTDVYSTGTVTINNGDTTLEGSGTTWTAGMIGRYVLLDGLWYEITARTDNDTITIDTYQGEDLSGATYVIANPNFNAKLANVTITGATGSGFIGQYTMEITIDNIFVYGCGTGMDLDYCTYTRISCSSDSNGVNLNMNFCEGIYIDYSTFNFSTTGAGIIWTNKTRNGTFFNTSVTDNTGNGMTITDTTVVAFISCDISGNGGKGIEFVSGCNDNQISECTFDGNASDNIKLTATSDRNTIVATSIKNAGGYGINIAASTCDNNQIISPAFDNNTSGDINNSGTNTVILPETYTFTAGETLYAGDCVFPTADNIIERSRPTSFASSSATFTETATTDGHHRTLYIDNTRTLHVVGGYRSTSKTLRASIGTVNAGETDLTYGTAWTGGSNSTTFDICQFDTYKFLLIWNYGNGTSTRAVVFDVGSSGDTITSGAEKNLITNGENSNDVACCKLDSGRVLVARSDTADSKLYVQVLSISTTTITDNAQVLLNAGTNSSKRVSLAYLTTNKVLCVFAPDSADTLRAVTIDVSGTTPTVNADNIIESTSQAYGIAAMAVLSPTKVALGYAWTNGAGGNSNNKNYVAVLSISGSTVTKGSDLQIAEGDSTMNSPEWSWNVVSMGSVLLTAVRTSNTDIKYHLLLVETTANTISSLATQTLSTSANDYASAWVCKFKPFKYIGAAGTQYSYVVLNLLNKTIGVTDEDIADTATGSVSIKGEVNSAFTGLTAGSIYYIDDNGRPSTDSSSVSVRLGVAFNTTSIPIES